MHDGTHESLRHPARSSPCSGTRSRPRRLVLASLAPAGALILVITTRNTLIYDEFFVTIAIFSLWIGTSGYQAHNLMTFYENRHEPAHYVAIFYKIRHELPQGQAIPSDVGNVVHYMEKCISLIMIISFQVTSLGCLN